jgi:hypothetical protein
MSVNSIYFRKFVNWVCSHDVIFYRAHKYRITQRKATQNVNVTQLEAKHNVRTCLLLISVSFSWTSSIFPFNSFSLKSESISYICCTEREQLGFFSPNSLIYDSSISPRKGGLPQRWKTRWLALLGVMFGLKGGRAWFVLWWKLLWLGLLSLRATANKSCENIAFYTQPYVTTEIPSRSKLQSTHAVSLAHHYLTIF